MIDDIKVRDTMSGLAKGLRVIEAFTHERPRLSVSEAARLSELDRATARRCLLTLAGSGYAEYDGKFFTLTPRVLRLGTGCLANMPLPRIVQPALDRLSDRIGQSTSVSILDEAEIVYVARAAQRRVMSIALMPGSRLPAYCTSMGRVLLAALPEGELRRILATRPIEKRTEFTIVDVEKIVETITEARESGYAEIDQEVEHGLHSLAVPLFNSRRKVVAALNVGLSSAEVPADGMVAGYLGALQAIQAEIAAVLP